MLTNGTKSRSALSRTINDFRDLNNLIKEKDMNENNDQTVRVGSDGRVIKTPTWTPTQLKHLGIMIKKYRQEKKMSQNELCRKCDLRDSYMGLIEAGKWHSIDRMNVESIAYNLGVDVEDLLIEVENTNVAIAEKASPKELFSRKRIHSEELVGDDFVLAYEVNDNEFIIKITTKDMGNQTVQVYKGKNFRQHPFLAAMEETIKMIRKAI